MNKHNGNKSPWTWVPSLYFIEGLPYFIVNTISVIMFKDFGMENGKLSLLTSLISLPWVLKPFWSPLVDILKSKRWWILLMQTVIAVSIALLAFSCKAASHSVFTFSLILFVVVAFASATHDISADGFYMLALDGKRQSAFVGIRNTFYRISMVFGQGVMVVLAGILERKLGNTAIAWQLTMVVLSVILAVFALVHFLVLPHPQEDEDRGVTGVSSVLKGSMDVFVSFFKKDGVWLAVAFMLLYRLPEAFSVKLLYPFFCDGLTDGGLALGKEAFGLVYGTFGVVALLSGGILGGLQIAKKGLRSCLLPMALALALPCSVYLLMSILQPSSVWFVGACVVLDQFGYGYGFTAYTVYMMRFADGPMKTSHYALCTGFMALSMLLPGLVAGYLQTALGYVGFFIMVMICCVATVYITLRARRRLSL